MDKRLTTKGNHLLEHEKRAIAREIAAGSDSKEICHDWEVSQATVSNIKKSQRELIEAEGEKYLQSLPDAVKVNQEHIKGIADGTITSRYDPVGYKEGMKCVENMLKAVGIIPSNSRSLHIQAIFANGQSSLLSKEVREALRCLIPNHIPNDADAHDVPEDEIIDV